MTFDPHGPDQPEPTQQPTAEDAPHLILEVVPAPSGGIDLDAVDDLNPRERDALELLIRTRGRRLGP